MSLELFRPKPCILKGGITFDAVYTLTFCKLLPMGKMGKGPGGDVRREALLVQKKCPSFLQHGLGLPLGSPISLHQLENIGQKGPLAMLSKSSKVLEDGSMAIPRRLPDMWHGACRGTEVGILDASGWECTGPRKLPAVSAVPKCCRLEVAEWSNLYQ